MEINGEAGLGVDGTVANALLSIAGFMRLAAQDHLKARLSGLFANAKEMRIYELSNGLRSTRELAELTSDDKSHISALWKKWSDLGIASSSGPQKPYMANFSLVELALNQEKKE
jgi:hypothetical protein